MSFKYFNVKNGLVTGNIVLHSANAHVQANYFLGNISVTSSANLGNVGNLRITGGTEGYVLQTDGTGNLSWASQGSESPRPNISNGNSNVNIPSANGNITFSAVGNANVMIITGTGANISGTANVTGNLTAGNIIVGTAGGGGALATGGNITNANVISANTFIALTSANFDAASNVNLGAVGNVKITGGTSSYVLSTDGTGNLSWVVQSGGGSSTISNGNSNVNIPAANGNVNISAVGNANVMIITGTGANISGTANVTGNLTAGNANLGNLVTANFFTGTLTTNAQPNITSVGTLTSLGVTGNANVGNLGTTNLVATGTGSFSGNVNMNSYNIISLATPVSDTDAATKGYVDSVAQGLDPKASVIYSTTTSLFGSGYTYNNGTSGLGATLTSSSNGALSIDGNTPAVGTRVLLKNEVGTYTNSTTQSAAFNGIYIVTQVGSGAAPFILTRSTDFDTGTEMSGAFVFVEAGATLADTGWVCTTNNPITVGTTQITWVQFSGAGTYTAGTGLTLTGTQFSISNTAVTAAAYGNGDTVATFTVNQQGQLTAAGNTSITANAANLTGATLNSSVITSSLTSVGSLTGLTVSNASGIVNFTTTANVTLGAVANLHISGGTSGYVLRTDGASNLSWIAPGSGSTNISNGNSNVNIPTANGNINFSAIGNANVVVITGTGANISGTANITGNVSAPYFIGNGYYLTGVDTSPANISNGNSNVNIPTANGNINFSAIGNANVVVITGTGANISGTANITGNVNAPYFIGNGYYLTGVDTSPANISNGNSNVNIATANGNINFSAIGNANVVVITGIGVNVAGDMQSTGNVNATYFVGNGFYLTGVSTNPANISNGTSNVEVSLNGNVTTSVNGNANILTVTGTGIVVTGNATIGTGTGGNLSGANIVTANLIDALTVNSAGNVNATYFVGNGAFLTGVATNPANISNGTSNVEVTLNGNVTTSVNGNANILVVTGTGIVVTGNATIGTGTGGNLSGANIVTANLIDALTVNASGNVNATYFVGNGFYLTGVDTSPSNITNGNSNVEVTLNSNIVMSVAGNANILTVTGTGINVTGTATIGAGTGGNISGANIISANTFTALTSVDFTSTSNASLGAVGNVKITGGTSGYVLRTDGAGNLSWIAPGSGSTGISNGNSNINIPAANGNVNISAVGNANVLVVTGTGANILGTANITGNVSAPYFIGNGFYLTGVDTSPANISNGNSQINVPTANGNIAVTVAGVGNTVVFSNVGVNVAGYLTSTGNVTAGNIIGIIAAGSNTITTTGNANVGNLGFGSGVITGTGNITAGNLIGIIAAGSNTITTTGNANVGNLGFGTGIITGTGNITTGNIIGVLANGNSNVNIPSANGNVNISAVGNANILVITGTGANITGYANVTGNVISGANVITDNILGRTGALTITSAGTNTNINLKPNGVGNIDANSTNITNVKDPTNLQDAATKAYVDSVAQGLDPKASVQLATTTTLPAYTYNNGTSGVNANITATATGALTIDSTSVANLDRILIKNETSTNAPYNGIYVVTNAGNATAAFILTRSTDFDIGTEMPGAFVFVEYGTTNPDTGWVCTTNNPITVGTTNITFVQFSGAGTYTAGTGLTLTGTQFSISNTALTPGTYGNGDRVSTFTVNQQGQLTAASNTAITANAANLTGTTLNASIITSSLTSVGTLGNLTSTGVVNFTGASNVSLGTVGNVKITGGSGSQFLQTDGIGNLTWASISTSSSLANGNSNVNIPVVNGNVNISAVGNANVVVITGTGANITGTLNVSGNANVGNIGATTFIGTLSGAATSAGTATTAGTVTTAAQGNITSVGTLTGLTVSGATVLGSVANITINGGSNAYVLQTDGSGVLSWVAQSGTSISVDNFTGNGVAVNYTLTATPANVNSTLVSIAGTFQPRTVYSLAGNVITFSSAPPNTAPIEVTTFAAGGGSSGYTYVEITANTSATANTKYIVNTNTSNLTVTLPSSPTLGTEVGIIDGTGNASVHAITVGRNGGNIQGTASDMTVTTNRSAFTLVYYNAAQGWILTNV